MTCTSISDLQERLKQRITEVVGLSTAQPLRLSEPPTPDRGDIAVACHGAAKLLRSTPDQLAEKLALALADDAGFEVAGADQGYLNLRIRRPLLLKLVCTEVREEGNGFGRSRHESGAPWLIEYSGPNTNKPLHIGHLRNTILGASLSRIVERFGQKVIRYNIINDRGIHICKSMVAYRRFGDGDDPKARGIKGDQFVGRYYSLFASKAAEEFERWAKSSGKNELEAFLATRRDALKSGADVVLRTRFLKESEAAGRPLPFKQRKVKPAEYSDRMKEETALEAEYRRWLAPREEEAAQVELAQGMKRFLEAKARDFEADVSELHREARETLIRWEENDSPTRALWRKMNDWVLEGIEQTYRRLQVSFDHVDYESEVYLLGKEVVGELLRKKIARRREDGAVVYDQPPKSQDEAPSEKILLRPDGTSVYITQDLGSLCRRVERHRPGRIIYVVGSEQELHFETLFRLVDLHLPGVGASCEHLSYGMVELPHGKMKSREGEIVEADEFLDDVHAGAAEQLRARSNDLPDGEVQRRAERIAIAAVKFHLLKYGKRSTVKFDVEAALDMNGKTGPYCLYAFARIQSILRKVGSDFVAGVDFERLCGELLAPEEASLVLLVGRFPEAIAASVRDTEPLHVAEYVYRLAKSFNSYYTASDPEGRTLFPVVQCREPELKKVRVALLMLVSRALALGLASLGIETLDEM